MKALRFLPFCFIADVHGFSLLAPYLVLFLVFVHMLVALQRKRATARTTASTTLNLIPISDIAATAA